MLLREYAIEWWFIIPPLLTNVSALPRETWTRKLCLFSMPQACFFSWRMWVAACMREGQRSITICYRSICYNWPVLFTATHILQEKTHACGVLKRHYVRVHVSLGSAETLVRRGGIINHHSIAYSLSNISAKNHRNRLMWVESIVCNISVLFWDTVYIYAAVTADLCQTNLNAALACWYSLSRVPVHKYTLHWSTQNQDFLCQDPLIDKTWIRSALHTMHRFVENWTYPWDWRHTWGW